MMNVAILVGRLGKEPEIKQTKGGKSYANLSVATSKKIRGKEVVQWHNVCVFGERIVAAIGEYLHKGSMVAVRGEITYSRWTSGGEQKFSVSILVGGNGGEIRFLNVDNYQPPTAGDVDKNDDGMEEMAGPNVDDDTPPF